MNSMQLHDIALYSDYRRGKTSFEYVNVRC